MPALAVMTEYGLELLDEFPAFLQEEPHARAVCHVWAKESERMADVAGEVSNGLIPIRLTDLTLPAWEALAKLPQNPPGLTTEQRRAAVLARLRSFAADPSGSSWIVSLAEQIGPGWTYEEDPVTPFLLRFTVPWSPGSERFQHATRVIAEQRPAAWNFIVASEEGFVLDHSQLDNEQFHAH